MRRRVDPGLPPGADTRILSDRAGRINQRTVFYGRSFSQESGEDGPAAGQLTEP